MVRTALIAAALLLGTAAEAKPYKITMTAGLYTSFLPGGSKLDTMTFQAIVNDPQVITTFTPGGDPIFGFDIFKSTTRIATYFDTKVDGASATKSFMDLTLSWDTGKTYETGGLSIHKTLKVGLNNASIPAMTQIATPPIDALCQTAYQPAGNCASKEVTSTLMIAPYSELIGIDTYLGKDDAAKDVLNFSLGNDSNINPCCVYSEIGWQVTAPAGYDGPDPVLQGIGVIDFNVSNFTISPVPEPASWAILITGFGMVGAAMRRKTRVLARA
ncbi:PEPxxWA-CTERM sorting domain-containing protein [Sphingomonas trueperi]|uniref:PEPxxWA-CTERM sorting domain-containing protein n=1 Tax=Sphingomonas trueperi TaxID=53317 RepID=UPI000F18DD9A